MVLIERIIALKTTNRTLEAPFPRINAKDLKI